MKSRIEGVTLTIETKKNALPTRKRVYGSLKLGKNQCEASFVEESIPLFAFGERKSVRVFQREGYSVYYNLETGRYRIHITVEPKEPRWVPITEDAFNSCLGFLARKCNA